MKHRDGEDGVVGEVNLEVLRIRLRHVRHRLPRDLVRDVRHGGSRPSHRRLPSTNCVPDRGPNEFRGHEPERPGGEDRESPVRVQPEVRFRPVQRRNAGGRHVRERARSSTFDSHASQCRDGDLPNERSSDGCRARGTVRDHADVFASSDWSQEWNGPSSAPSSARRHFQGTQRAIVLFTRCRRARVRVGDHLTSGSELAVERLEVNPTPRGRTRWTLGVVQDPSRVRAIWIRLGELARPA